MYKLKLQDLNIKANNQQNKYANNQLSELNCFISKTYKIYTNNKLNKKQKIQKISNIKCNDYNISPQESIQIYNTLQSVIPQYHKIQKDFNKLNKIEQQGGGMLSNYFFTDYDEYDLKFYDWLTPIFALETIFGDKLSVPLDLISIVLDIVGIVLDIGGVATAGIGTVAGLLPDIINIVLSLLRREFVTAALTALSLIPLVGNIAVVAKWVGKATKYIMKGIKYVTKGTSKATKSLKTSSKTLARTSKQLGKQGKHARKSLSKGVKKFKKAKSKFKNMDDFNEAMDLVYNGYDFITKGYEMIQVYMSDEDANEFSNKLGDMYELFEKANNLYADTTSKPRDIERILKGIVKDAKNLDKITERSVKNIMNNEMS